MDVFDQLVRDFLEAEKLATGRLRWAAKGRDFVQARSKLVAGDGSALSGEMVIVAHLRRKPPKYAFLLLSKRRRVLALDMNPGRAHTNVGDLSIVRGTHWQVWPIMDAEADGTIHTYRHGLGAFLRRARIRLKYPFRLPPAEGSTQMWLDL